MTERDVDLFVIGGGSGGVRAARVAAQHGASVAIAEEYRYGGTCVIRGCIPKKLFVYSAEFGHVFEDAAGYGWSVEARFDWPTLVARKDQEIERLSGIYQGLLAKHGVQVVHGRARLADRHTVVVGDDRWRAGTILVATGGYPHKPDVPGAEHAITSNEIFHLEALPTNVTVVGGGYIGLEFAGILQGLGCEVALVHHRAEVLRGFDDDVRHFVTENLRAQGVEMLFDTEVSEIRPLEDGRYHFQCRDGSHHETDLVMFATGRLPKTANLGLEKAGVVLGKRGAVVVDETSRSSVENIYAVGDCTDRLQLTPVAIREGQAFADDVFGDLEVSCEHELVPTAIFSQPPVATVGLTEKEARALGRVQIYRSTFRPLFHTLSGREQKVMMKLVVDAESQRVLGVHMVGRDAPEIIQALAVAVRMKATKSDFDRTLAVHPTTAEELVLMRTPEAE